MNEVEELMAQWRSYGGPYADCAEDLRIALEAHPGCVVDDAMPDLWRRRETWANGAGWSQWAGVLDNGDPTYQSCHYLLQPAHRGGHEIEFAYIAAAPKAST